MIKITLHIIFLMTILNACMVSNKALKPEEYQKWYSSEKFVWKAVDTINEMVYAFRYFPDEVTISNCAIQNSMTQEELKESLKNKSEDYTFIFELKSKNWNQSIFDLARSGVTQSEIVTYLNGQIQNDIKAVSSNSDTLNCTSVIYEPVSSSKVRLLISFESNQTISELVLYDRIFSGYKQTFSFPELSLQNTPSLKI